jgi:hypothetical protein
MTIHVTKETRHILHHPSIFFFPSPKVHPTVAVDHRLISDGLGKPILTPTIPAAARTQSGQMISGVHIGTQHGHAEGQISLGIRELGGYNTVQSLHCRLWRNLIEIRLGDDPCWIDPGSILDRISQDC